MKTIISVLLILVNITIFAQYGKVQVPRKTNDYVNDYANVLSFNEEESLRLLCSSIEKETSSQVAVVITNDLYEGYSIEDYSFELANRWGIGQLYKNNGLLVLICPNIHESRLEVGSGLEPVLTDIYTKQLQRTHFNPNFRNGDFYTGIANLLSEVKTTLVAESKQPDSYQTTPQELSVEPIQRPEPITIKNQDDGNGLVLLFFVIAGLGILGLIAYLIYSRYAEKEAKKELEQQAKNVKAELNSYFLETKRRLQTIGTFLNADQLLDEINLGHLMMDDKFKNQPYENYGEIALKEKSKIQDITSSIFSKVDLKNKIENDLNKIDQLTISTRKEYENAIKEYSHIARNYANNLLGKITPPTENIETFLLGIKEAFVEAKRYCNDLNFVSAESCLQEGKTKLNSLKKFIEQINGINQSIVSAEAYLKDADVTYKKLYRVVEDAMDNTYVSDTTVRAWDNFKKNKLEIKHTTDPLAEKYRVEQYLKKMQSFKDQAEKDERDEQARRRRIREASYSNSSSTVGRSSTSFGSSSSSKTSFGGGKFSGGGSSNKW